MNLFRQVSDLANWLRPVAVTLDKGQNDNTTIADACDIFYSLTLEPVLQDHLDKVQKRFDFVIKPCHLAAYMFHPKYMGEHLSQEQVETVKEWLGRYQKRLPTSSLCLSSGNSPISCLILQT